MKRLRLLEEKNTRPKRLVVNSSLDKEMFQEVVRQNVKLGRAPAVVDNCARPTGSAFGGHAKRILWIAQPIITVPAALTSLP
jgi:hypothetical protein